MQNYFQNCATLDEAKKLYRKLAFQLHPDHNGVESEAAFKEMKNQFEDFKPESEKFIGEFDKHNATDFMAVIEQLMKIPNIEIEICGSFIWLDGDTKPVKDQIKAVESEIFNKPRWSKGKSKWYFSRVGYRRYNHSNYSMEEIRAKYGSNKKKTEDKRQLAAA